LLQVSWFREWRGMYGKMGGLVAPDTWASDAEDCDICPLAYQYQKALFAEAVDCEQKI